MNQPLVSIVIPIYNVEHFLDRCIESVVNQTYTNLEIILVDDGSPDRCPIMCDEWAEKDSRIRVIHQANSGQGLARNAGIALAKGEYICFFDSDDYVDLTLVEKCVYSACNNNSDAVLYGRWDVKVDGKKASLPLHVEQTVYHGNAVTEQLLPGLFTYDMGLGVGACGRMYKLSVLKDNSIWFLSERKISSEDAFFSLMFFKHAQHVSIVTEQLYYYCAHETSFSHAYRADRQEKNNAFLVTCLDYIKQTGMPQSVANHLRARYHLYTVAHMKQIVGSELSHFEKWKAFRSVFDDKVLLNSLTREAISLCNRKLVLFWNLFLKRNFYLCYYLLFLKVNK